MRDIHRDIILLLEGKSPEGLDIISNIFYKQVNKIESDYLGWQKEDLLQEFILKIFENRTSIIEKFKDKESGLASYIREMAKNFLIDKLRQKKMDMEDISNYYYSIEDRGNNPEKLLKLFEAKNFMKLLENYLSPEEYTLLCYQIFKESQKSIRESFFNNVKDDALYQRVSRLNKKIGKIAKENGFSVDSVEAFIEEMLPKMCKERLGL